MSDIQLCDGGNCPHKAGCFRHDLKAAAKCEELMDPPYYFSHRGFECPDFIESPKPAA